MECLLELKNVSYIYCGADGETPALKEISFSLSPGKFLAVTGPSGCGKSTLLSLISGLIQPETGTICRHGTSIGYMLQKDHLFEWRTIYQNVILGLEIQHKLNARTHELADSLLCTYGLSAFRNAHPSQLSGGMRQRAALIRTLVLEPELLLLDEPFSALDAQTRLAVCDDIFRILKKEKKTAILVTHDIGEAISMADEILVLSARPGRIRCRIPVAFPDEDRSPLHVRSLPAFQTYYNHLWKELNPHV